MARERKTSISKDREGREQISGAPGTTRGRAGTAGSEGANVARSDRAGRSRSSESEGRRAGGLETGSRGVNEEEERERVRREQEEGTEEGFASSGRGRSGTVPGSIGGTTGTGEGVQGTQSPGATEPGVRGIDPEEASRRMRRRRS